METGTIYLHGKCDCVEVMVIDKDTDTDYREVVKIDGQTVSVIPTELQEQYAHALDIRKRVTPGFAEDWLWQ